MSLAPQDPAGFRPKSFPPPEFPPRKLPLFARMPPAVFTPILGLLGLGLVLGVFVAPWGQLREVAHGFGGLVVGLWGFAALGYLVKLSRHPAALLSELQTLPGRAGVTAALMGGSASASLMAPFLPMAAQFVLVISLAAHLSLSVLVGALILRGPAEARTVSPVLLLSFVGYVLGVPAALEFGWVKISLGLFSMALMAAILIMSASLVQLIRRNPPAPLRPLLAIHLAALSLLSISAQGLGFAQTGFVLLALGGAVFLALLLALPYLTAAGFSPLWGAFTFPLAAFAKALFVHDLDWSARAVTLVAAVVIPVIAWKILRLWPTGALAAATNAVTALRV